MADNNDEMGVSAGIAALSTVDEAAKLADVKDSFQSGKEDVPDYLVTSLVSAGIMGQGIPVYGDWRRDSYLKRMWLQEPILAGAVYAIVAKIGALSWTITGPADTVDHYVALINTWDGLEGNWQPGIQKFTQALLTLDRGAFVECIREGGTPAGEFLGFRTIDPLRCRPNPNDPEYPILFKSYETSQWEKVPAGLVAHQAIMPTPHDSYHGIGFSPVSRALTAANILLLLSQHDQEKLSNLPPQGIATVSGIGKKTLMEAFTIYKAQRQNQGSTVWPGILWLFGPSIGGSTGDVSVTLTSFSQLPDQFDRGLIYEIYVKTLAICFGVDVSEFWQVEHRGITKAEALVQHVKAKGKGPGDVALGIERWVNRVLPPGVVFEFDKRDDDEDRKRAERAEVVSRYLMNMVKLGILSPEQGLQVATAEGVIPPEVFRGPRVVREDSDAAEVIAKMAYAQDKELVQVDQDGVVVNRWHGNRSTFFTQKTLSEEVASLPNWRKGDLDEWGRALGQDFMQEFMNDVDARAAGFGEDEGDNVATE